jgi:hypothetical protein
VGECAGRKRKGNGSLPVFPHDDTCGHQGYEEEKIVEEEPAVPDVLREVDVPERLIDEIWQGCSNDTLNGPSVIMQEVCEQEADDDAGEDVEDEEHMSG